MTPETETRGGWALDLLSFGLWLALVGLAIAGPLFVGFSAVAAFSESNDSYTSVSGRLDPPYTVDLDKGRSIAVAADGSTEFSGFDSTPFTEFSFSAEAPSVEMMVPLTSDHWWQELLGTALILPLLALGWVATFSLWRVVRSGRDGDPFTRRNVSRLRWVAACAAAAPVVFGVDAIATRYLLVDEVNASVVIPSWQIWVVIAVVMVAMAEVLRAGVDLRDLTERTV